VPSGAGGGNQILYQASPVGSPPTSFTNVQNVTTVGGGTDASPFYSADGKYVYFSSNATSTNGNFVIYSLPAAVSAGSCSPFPGCTEPLDARVIVSLGPANTNDQADDLTPSVSPDGSEVLFVRDLPSPRIMMVPVANGAPTGAPVQCFVTGTPALADARVGDSSRPVFDPVDGTKFVYEDNAGQFHLVSWPAGSVCSGAPTADVTITSNSIVAGSTAGSEYFENPDWAADGSNLVLDTNAFPTTGANVLARLAMSPLPAGPTAPTALWAQTAVIPCQTTGTNINQGHEYQPVYSPANDSIAFTETACGSSQVEFIDPAQSGLYKASNASVFSSAQNVLTSLNSPTACVPGRFNRTVCHGINSEPDWQPVASTSVPETKYLVLFPTAGLALGALVLGARRRRRTATA
jgi:hypothetical protein